MRLRSKIAYLTIINVYAPTEEAKEDEKDNFYDELKEVCERRSKEDTLIIIGDTNAKIGKE